MSRVHRRFQIDQEPDGVAERLRAMRWKVQGREGNRLEAQQGSQVTMRLLGGWFVNARKLPKHLLAEAADGVTTIDVEETMGLGVMDPKLRRKYEEAFAELERELAG